jgi:photosynthetic reaction center cytochrome c subunit
MRWCMLLVIATSAACFVLLPVSLLPAQAMSPDKPAEQVYKNIQVLKGVPAEQIIPAMQFITASLGVQCDFCHLENAFEKDDKPTKQTARKMMRMMFAINKDNFEGKREVTCYACHRGAHKPLVTPTLNDDDLKFVEQHDMHGEEVPDSNLPSAEQIIAKYLAAVGGLEANVKILTRLQKGTLIVGSEHFPVEIVSKTSSERVTTVHFPGGDSITAISGREGWLGSPGRAPHQMSPSEANAAKLDAELFFPASLGRLFKEFHVQQQGVVNGKEVYAITATTEEGPATQLYFDQHSGFLVRVLRLTESPLGRNPTEIDYADYREADGVKTPFRWTISRPGGRFTIQIEDMKQNVPVPTDSFKMPSV